MSLFSRSLSLFHCLPEGCESFFLHMHRNWSSPPARSLTDWHRRQWQERLIFSSLIRTAAFVRDRRDLDRLISPRSHMLTDSFKMQTPSSLSSSRLVQCRLIQFLSLASRLFFLARTMRTNPQTTYLHFDEVNINISSMHVERTHTPDLRPSSSSLDMWREAMLVPLVHCQEWFVSILLLSFSLLSPLPPAERRD